MGGRDIVGGEEGFKLGEAEEQEGPTEGSGDFLVSTSSGFRSLLSSLDIEL